MSEVYLAAVAVIALLVFIKFCQKFRGGGWF